MIGATSAQPGAAFLEVLSAVRQGETEAVVGTTNQRPGKVVSVVLWGDQLLCHCSFLISAHRESQISPVVIFAPLVTVTHVKLLEPNVIITTVTRLVFCKCIQIMTCLF